MRTTKLCGLCRSLCTKIDEILKDLLMSSWIYNKIVLSKIIKNYKWTLLFNKGFSKKVNFKNVFCNIIKLDMKESQSFLKAYFCARIYHQSAYASWSVLHGTPEMSFMIPVTSFASASDNNRHSSNYSHYWIFYKRPTWL